MVAHRWRRLFRCVWLYPVLQRCQGHTFFLDFPVLGVTLLRYLSAVGLCLGCSDRLLLRVCLTCCVVLVGYDLRCRRIGLIFLLVGSLSPCCFLRSECDDCVCQGRVGRNPVAAWEVGLAVEVLLLPWVFYYC